MRPSMTDSGRAHPQNVGVGLKLEHVGTILQEKPEIGFFEVHAENYMMAGGPFHRHLERIRADYPLSLHGVGLSIGGEASLDEAHLDRLAALIDRYQPDIFSEHLAWSSHHGIFYNDLLPLPYQRETLHRVCEHVDRIQTRLGCRMLLENPATYVEFETSTLSETTFISEVVKRTGCGLMLDVSNAHVSSVNHHRDIAAYLDALPLAEVGEIHLAGYFEDVDSAGDRLLIDSHGSAVAAPVWDLYSKLIALIGPRPTLIERDQDIPAFQVLAEEAHRASAIMARHVRLTT